MGRRGPATIIPLGSTLVVSADETAHRQIEALLDCYRRRWSKLRIITLQADWLFLSDGQLAGLLKGGQAEADSDDPPACRAVDEAAWQRLLKQLQEVKGEQPAGYRAVITCFDGQTVHTIAGGQELFIISVIPVVGDNGSFNTLPRSERSVGYQPVCTTLQEGAVLQVTPVSTPTGQFVVLDVQSRVVQFRGTSPTARPAAEAAANRDPSIVRDLAEVLDRPAIAYHRLAATTRVPVNRRVLVGGMGLESEPAAGEPLLYLFVKVSVKEPSEKLPPVKPTLSPRKRRAPGAETPDRTDPPAEAPADTDQPAEPNPFDGPFSGN
jgi:hypothetical protein